MYTPRTALALVVLGIIVAATVAKAQADGTVSMRGAYYKERSTRVIQPMIDVDLETAGGDRLQAHTVVDAITSASAASGAAGVAFTETRTQVGANYLFDAKTVRFGGGFRHSSENDYKSNYIMGRLETDLAQQNTSVAINIARGMDEINNSGSQGGISAIITGELDTTMVSATVGQVLSPNSMAQLSYDLMHHDGFQQNIYRTVVAGGMITPERVPDNRLRHAIAGTLRYYLDATDTALVGTYRFYKDDWGILANTPEMRVIQEFFAGDFETHVSYRYHRQRAADFYKDVYDESDPNLEPFVTADFKHGRIRSHTVGLKVAARLALFGIKGSWEDVRVEASGQYWMQDTPLGNAVISQLALVVPVKY